MIPRVSLLLPARGRPSNLRASVDSVFALAARPDEVEVVVRLDVDDPHLSTEASYLATHPWSRVRVFRGPRLGYGRMHGYYNGLAKLCRSDLLFIWNDDMEMVSDGWDELICDAPRFSVQFPRRDITKTTDYTLPVVGRPLFAALGNRLSSNAYVDAWLSDVSGFSGTSIVRDDVVFKHHRLDDQTLREQGIGGPRQWELFKSDEQKALRRADMDAIMTAPDWASRFDGWNVEYSEHVEVAHINLRAGEAKAGAYRLKGRK